MIDLKYFYPTFLLEKDARLLLPFMTELTMTYKDRALQVKSKYQCEEDKLSIGVASPPSMMATETASSLVEYSRETSGPTSLARPHLLRMIESLGRIKGPGNKLIDKRDGDSEGGGGDISNRDMGGR